MDPERGKLTCAVWSRSPTKAWWWWPDKFVPKTAPDVLGRAPVREISPPARPRQWLRAGSTVGRQAGRQKLRQQLLRGPAQRPPCPSRSSTRHWGLKDVVTPCDCISGRTSGRGDWGIGFALRRWQSGGEETWLRMSSTEILYLTFKAVIERGPLHVEMSALEGVKLRVATVLPCQLVLANRVRPSSPEGRSGRSRAPVPGQKWPKMRVKVNEVMGGN